jgi:hypothetical protein
MNDSHIPVPQTARLTQAEIDALKAKRPVVVDWAQERRWRIHHFALNPDDWRGFDATHADYIAWRDGASDAT